MLDLKLKTLKSLVISTWKKLGSSEDVSNWALTIENHWALLQTLASLCIALRYT